MQDDYTFTGNEGGIISESDARQFIANYHMGPCITWNQGVHGHFFGKKLIEELLKQRGAKGIRIYYGSKPSASSGVLEPQLILVAANANGDDMLSQGKIADISRPCPKFCPKGVGLII